MFTNSIYYFSLRYPGSLCRRLKPRGTISALWKLIWCKWGCQRSMSADPRLNLCRTIWMRNTSASLALALRHRASKLSSTRAAQTCGSLRRSVLWRTSPACSTTNTTQRSPRATRRTAQLSTFNTAPALCLATFQLIQSAWVFWYFLWCLSGKKWIMPSSFLLFANSLVNNSDKPSDFCVRWEFRVR